MGAINPFDIVASGLGGLGYVVNTAVPFATQIGRLVSDVENLTGRTEKERQENLLREQQLALRQLQERQQSALRNLQERTNLEREKLQAETLSVENRRQVALRRAVARQRTNFAARGLSANDTGSAEAILFGLLKESDTERQERERLDNLRNRALDQDVAAQKRLNVLQRSQLAARQDLQRLIEGF